MGGNGSYAAGTTNSEAGRKYKTVGTIGDILIIEKKNPKDSHSLPEESHTPNRIYAEIRSDGKDVGKIAKYGPDGKKIWEIHTTPHKDLKDHYHEGKNGAPTGEPKQLTQEMKDILKKVRDFID